MVRAFLVRISYNEDEFDSDGEARDYIEAMLEEMENRSERNGHIITATIVRQE